MLDEQPNTISELLPGRKVLTILYNFFYQLTNIKAWFFQLALESVFFLFHKNKVSIAVVLNE